MLCRHCHFSPVSRPRGLCWHCYYMPGVRDRYMSTSKYGNRGPGNFNGEVPVPAMPTDALPGSPEKMEVLAQRALNRQALWHPDDATWEGPRVQRQLQRVG